MPPKEQRTLKHYFPLEYMVQRRTKKFSFPVSSVNRNPMGFTPEPCEALRLQQKQLRRLATDLQQQLSTYYPLNKQQQDGYLFNVSATGILVTLISIVAILVVGLYWQQWQLEYNGELSISEFCAKDDARYCILLAASLLFSVVLMMKITNISKILHKRGFPTCLVVLAWFLQIAGLVGFLMLGVYRTNKREEVPSLGATLHKLGASMFVLCSNLGMIIQSNSIVSRSINRMACAVISLCLVSILAAVMFGCTIANNGPALVTLEIFSVALIIVCYNLCSWTIPPIAEDGTLGDAELNGVCGRGRVVCAG